MKFPDEGDVLDQRFVPHFELVLIHFYVAVKALPDVWVFEQTVVKVGSRNAAKHGVVSRLDRGRPDRVVHERDLTKVHALVEGPHVELPIFLDLPVLHIHFAVTTRDHKDLGGFLVLPN